MSWSVARGDLIEIIARDRGSRKPDIQDVVAHLRPGNRSTRQPIPDADPAAVFAITDRPAAGADDVDGWWLRVPPSVSNEIEPGFYLVDFRMIFGPEDERTTRPVPIEITEPATVHSGG